MRIAVYHNQPSGGARRALFGFCRELTRRNELDIFTLSSADQTLIDDRDLGVPVTVLPYAPRSETKFGLYLNDVQRFRALGDLDRVAADAARRIDGGNYDVTLVDVCRYTQAPAVLRHLQTPSAYYCHEPPRRFYETSWQERGSAYAWARTLRRFPFRMALDRRMRREDRELVGRARTVLTNSTYNQARLRAIYGVEATVCPPGVEPRPQRERREDNYVLSVGAVQAHKGFDFVIESLAAVAETDRPDLHVVGNEGNPRLIRRLQELAASRGVGLRVRLAVGDAELEQEYEHALVFVYGSHHEPLGQAPLEAMAHGVPVVAVAEGAVGEGVIDRVSGYLVPRNTADFAAAVTKLLASPELRREMGAAGRSTIEQQWSWAARGRRLEDALRAVARGAG
jgi:glycosyltransferase involved in cell wall biosynthesis